jgi:hypothetical protein
MTECFFLGHNGLGDNITNISAINYLLNYYSKIFFLCKDIYHENLKLIFNNPHVILVPFDHKNEDKERFKILIPQYKKKNMDVLISGFCHKENFRSKIQNSLLKDRIKNHDFNIDNKYIHIKNFYEDINLDLSIYYNYFNINNSDYSQQLYKNIQKYKIVFMHTLASNGSIDLSDYINKYKDLDDYLIICTNTNIYEETHIKYDIAKDYVNLLIVFYIDIIKNSDYIYIIDSCFSSIVIPLQFKNELKAVDCNIFDRIQ